MNTIKVRTPYVLVGSDFSQQEPRLLSYYSQDENMIEAYKNGKDLYAMIASKVYHNNYEDNLEHNPDGTLYVEGKNRRASVKGLLLGIMYGMSDKGIANRLKCSVEEATDIKESFFKEFPKVKKWMDDTVEFAKKNGYVEDWYGRRRRLPILLEQDYSANRKEDYIKQFQDNPFLDIFYDKKKDARVKYYENELKSIKWHKEFTALEVKATLEGIELHNNKSAKSAAERQCVNARIQGGAATMTKIAMIKLFNDEELKKMDFHILILVHDEIIGECPKRYATQVADRLSYIMRTCIEDYCNVPFKCDAAISTSWYEEEYEGTICKEYKYLIEGDKEKGILPLSKEDAFAVIVKNHEETDEDKLKLIIENSN